MAGTRETGYTTTLKLMQIMTEKGLVTRDETSRTHVYAARASEVHTQGQLVADLLERAFGGSAAALVQRALSTHRASSEELIEIRKLIDRYQEERP
jgi:predicted transcriptional regulator